MVLSQASPSFRMAQNPFDCPLNLIKKLNPNPGTARS